jgi:2,4-dienoyl-CoA reductase-like NADH-dependent reductase (Old Yellow Enzyme family)/thioredoxin reductase
MNKLDHLFKPIRIGTMNLRNRIMLPPHGAAIGNLWGSADEAKQNVAYWASRAKDGAAWIDGITGFVDHSKINPPGFLPTGLGAVVHGVFRLPHFVERAGMYADAIHEMGACATSQLVLQGGMPHSPSAKIANYTNNSVSHEMTIDEIRWLVEEYGFSGKQAKAAGLEGIEFHANHEDLHQLFLSPATNRRDDEYGGDFERRLQFIKDCLTAIRAETGSDFTIGIRFNLNEFFDGGYETDEGIKIAKALEATGQVDYIHGVIGNNWGAPSYIQPHIYGLAQWSELAGQYRKALRIPIVYAGRVSDIETAEHVLAQGHADVVGMARAMFADENIVSKSKTGRIDQIRPCIGCNDCLHAMVVESLPFGCSINPRTGRESMPEPQKAETSKKVLIVGGGPAGMELAGALAERGHIVTLWERENHLGGQMHVASASNENRSFADFIDYQARRLKRLGVDVTLAKTATKKNVVDFQADEVAIATGASSRRPQIDGVDLPFVFDGRDVMTGKVETGPRVAVIAAEDHMQPLTIAGFLGEQGKEVQLIYQTPSIAPTVGKYSIGAPLAKISEGGGTVRVMERVTTIEQGRISTRNVYSGVAGEVTDFDSVVLACGGSANNELHGQLTDKIEQLHLLGDAFAPRRIWFATRQAYELAQTI